MENKLLPYCPLEQVSFTMHRTSRICPRYYAPKYNTKKVYCEILPSTVNQLFQYYPTLEENTEVRITDN